MAKRAKDPPVQTDISQVEAGMQDGPLKSGRVQITHFEQYRRTEAVEQLVLRGIREQGIVYEMREQFHIGKWATLRIIKFVRERLIREGEEERPYHKVMAERRILRAISKALAVGNLGIYAVLEKQLAVIQGTEAPLRLDVASTITLAATRAIGNLTEQEADAMLEEYAEMQRLAERAKATLALDAS